MHAYLISWYNERYRINSKYYLKESKWYRTSIILLRSTLKGDFLRAKDKIFLIIMIKNPRIKRWWMQPWKQFFLNVACRVCVTQFIIGPSRLRISVSPVCRINVHLSLFFYFALTIYFHRYATHPRGGASNAEPLQPTKGTGSAARLNDASRQQVGRSGEGGGNFRRWFLTYEAFISEILLLVNKAWCVMSWCDECTHDVIMLRMRDVIMLGMCDVILLWMRDVVMLRMRDVIM